MWLQSSPCCKIDHATCRQNSARSLLLTGPNMGGKFVLQSHEEKLLSYAFFWEGNSIFCISIRDRVSSWTQIAKIKLHLAGWLLQYDRYAHMFLVESAKQDKNKARASNTWPTINFYMWCAISTFQQHMTRNMLLVFWTNSAWQFQNMHRQGASSTRYL